MLLIKGLLGSRSLPVSADLMMVSMQKPTSRRAFGRPSQDEGALFLVA
jgi:hypothetical protein